MAPSVNSRRECSQHSPSKERNAWRNAQARTWPRSALFQQDGRRRVSQKQSFGLRQTRISQPQCKAAQGTNCGWKQPARNDVTTSWKIWHLEPGQSSIRQRTGTSPFRRGSSIVWQQDLARVACRIGTRKLHRKTQLGKLSSCCFRMGLHDAEGPKRDIRLRTRSGR